MHAVPSSQMQPGDILEFAGDSHVGIYVGGGEMVDAPHTGADVREEAADWPDLVGATRVDPAVAAQVGGPRFP